MYIQREQQGIQNKNKSVNVLNKCLRINELARQCCAKIELLHMNIITKYIMAVRVTYSQT